MSEPGPILITMRLFIDLSTLLYLRYQAADSRG